MGKRDFIRHWDGTRDKAEKIAAQGQRGSVKIVQWNDIGTPAQEHHRIVKTLKDAERLCSVWKRWQERRGKHVYSHPRWMRCYPPDKVGVKAVARQCAVVEVPTEVVRQSGR